MPAVVFHGYKTITPISSFKYRVLGPKLNGTLDHVVFRVFLVHPVKLLLQNVESVSVRRSTNSLIFTDFMVGRSTCGGWSQYQLQHLTLHALSLTRSYSWFDTTDRVT